MCRIVLCDFIYCYCGLHGNNVPQCCYNNQLCWGWVICDRKWAIDTQKKQSLNEPRTFEKVLCGGRAALEMSLRPAQLPPNSLVKSCCAYTFISHHDHGWTVMQSTVALKGSMRREWERKWELISDPVRSYYWSPMGKFHLLFCVIVVMTIHNNYYKRQKGNDELVRLGSFPTNPFSPLSFLESGGIRW